MNKIKQTRVSNNISTCNEKNGDDMSPYVKQNAREFCFELETHVHYNAIATRCLLPGGQLI